MGGIGFRDLHLFNLALLGKQVWRLMIQKDTLCFKVFSAKYFPDGNVFRHKHYDKPSFTWASIAKATDAVKDGFMWQVGDDNMIDIRWDHWRDEGLKGKSVGQSLFTNNEKKVKDLWDHNDRQWKRERVIEIYDENLGDYICNLAIPPNKFFPYLDVQRLKKPPDGYVKVNVDAAVLIGCIEFGAIARDHDGFLLGGYYGHFEKFLEATWAELEALVESLNLASLLNVANLILESDNLMLVNTVKKRKQDVTILGQYVKQECKAFKNFDSVQINWIDRNSNNVAELLCNLVIKNKINLYFDMDYSLEIHNIIIHEAIN
ncbi:hypothetical protein J1N35_041779 [Gossypium stocksii]|uniref:RNase H type-1 domain-containing protein n=1 Tax=Gossypium stocksii TaxID=47602 RepID=A0A9D3UGD5_9ROSI|nr:hypothetical protein J1N35_041779 [Gossypium stocksii]